MFLLTLASKYSSYIRDFYLNHPDEKTKSYKEQYDFLMSESYGSSEIWSVGMSSLSYKTERIFVNAEQLQRQWAFENGIETIDDDWQHKTLFAQVKYLQPDIIFINNHTLLSSSLIDRLRSENKSIKLVIGWCGIPYKDPDIFRKFDIVLSNIPELVEEFHHQGHVVFHINHAFDPRIIKNINTEREKKIDFSFIGSIIKDTNFHTSREKLLLDLVQKTDLKIWGNIFIASIIQKMYILLLQITYDTVEFLVKKNVVPKSVVNSILIKRILNMQPRPTLKRLIHPNLIKRYQPPIFGLEMYQRLCDSKITLNTHIDVSTNSASNMRLFEATGVGTCLLTDWKENIRYIFEPDIEVATYNNSEECIAKVNFLLQNEETRKEIAQAGQKRTLNNHTIYHRAEQVDEIIKKELRKR